jgi:hypothetical protein
MQKAPTYIKVKGHLYKRADEGPATPGAIPKAMSPEEVLSEDFGVPAEDMEKLKKYKNQKGKSLYDILSTLYS